MTQIVRDRAVGKPECMVRRVVASEKRK